MALIIKGLEANYYYSNNPIIVEITDEVQSIVKADYFTIKIGDLGTLTITPINVFLIGRQVKIDISSHIKSLLPNLNRTSSLISVPIVITSYKITNGVHNIITTVTITKYYLRGGKRGNYTNVTAVTQSILKTTDKMPYWLGYPTTYSFLNTTAIDNVVLNPDGRNDVDRRKVKGCNSTYIMFLNSLGGYSYWMFEGVTDQQKNTNVGTINNTQTIDLGNSYEQELELYSKVPQSYMSLIQDLIISPDIYVYRIGEQGAYWERYISGSNTIEAIPAKNAQEVKIKLKPFNKFNPQIVWQ